MSHFSFNDLITDRIWIERRKQNCKAILSSASFHSFAIFSLTENNVF